MTIISVLKWILYVIANTRKPKRTVMWVTLGVVSAILFCGGLAAVLVFLLVPRTIVVDFVPIVRTNVTFVERKTQICKVNETHRKG